MKWEKRKKIDNGENSNLAKIFFRLLHTDAGKKFTITILLFVVILLLSWIDNTIKIKTSNRK